ncbi:ABC transporter ATP-binding protein [Mucilaginibacter sp. KACC 22773]|uniref:ABC transporter ATP-binding protein n=1 Tax=Mucilaginibacter sp. KACC 22773 TaxID=3025671 RepID=UPI0023671777|nr:ABC transporter ATP-binding protein [Mucilaginibacter sp. KACC 22773]WDF77675.1 ABC transporter ATP-binding protein [Mucilaginibacter sp. KACC 22773]
MKIKNRKSLELTRRYLKYFRPYVFDILLLIALMIISSAGSLATPYVLKIIIDQIFPKGDFIQLITILSLLVLVYILRIVCNLWTDILDNKISQNVVGKIRVDMLNSLFMKDITFFKNVNTGDVLFTIIDDVRNIQTTLSSLILSLLNDVFVVIGIVVMLSILNFKLTLISLFIIPMIMYSIRKFAPLIQKHFKEVQASEGLLNNFFLQCFKNIRVIKSYEAFNIENKKLFNINSQIYSSNKSSTFFSSINGSIVTFFIAIGPILVLIIGGKSVFAGALTLGALIAFIQYINRLYSPAISIMRTYNQINKAIISMERVLPYLPEEKKGVAEFDKPLHCDDIINFDKLVFDDVSYSINEEEILSGLNVEFKKGHIYGVIGPSGSGKSTIINLICGFLSPSGGSIRIDDSVCISQIKNWKSNLGLIEKENQLFSDTIISNLKYGSVDASQEDVIKAVEHAMFKEVLDNNIVNYDSVITDTGSTLSDGQKQRISIARALVKAPQIIIFDEATSSLDPTLERSIINNLKKYYNNSIIIIITHRVSSLQAFDFVYAIEKGSLAKKGLPVLFTNN